MKTVMMMAKEMKKDWEKEKRKQKKNVEMLKCFLFKAL